MKINLIDKRQPKQKASLDFSGIAPTQTTQVWHEPKVVLFKADGTPLVRAAGFKPSEGKR